MAHDTTQPFRYPAILGKKFTAAFDGGRLSSDGGVMLLAEAARRMGIAEKLADVIPDRRGPTRVVQPLPEILLAHILAIACDYVARAPASRPPPWASTSAKLLFVDRLYFWFVQTDQASACDSFLRS